MAQINLLPWREERREELKKEFLTILAVVAVAAVLLVFMFGSIVKGQIEEQQSRNNFLDQNINDLANRVSEISELEQRREDLLDRMKIIQDLQGNRPIIVRVFDEMVRTVPDGLYYTQLTRANNSIRVAGLAESSNRVSSLMRRLDSSDWFSDPNLTGVRSNADFGDQGNDFELTVNIQTPSSVTDDDNMGGSK